MACQMGGGLFHSEPGGQSFGVQVGGEGVRFQSDEIANYINQFIKYLILEIKSLECF